MELGKGPVQPATVTPQLRVGVRGSPSRSAAAKEDEVSSLTVHFFHFFIFSSFHFIFSFFHFSFFHFFHFCAKCGLKKKVYCACRDNTRWDDPCVVHLSFGLDTDGCREDVSHRDSWCALSLSTCRVRFRDTQRAVIPDDTTTNASKTLMFHK